jgi:hypothetical protein
VTTESAYTDPELHDWLIWAEKTVAAFFVRLRKPLL